MAFDGPERSRMRDCTSFRHLQRPLDGFKVHFAHVGVVPGLLGVAEGRVEDAALSVHLAPRHGKIMVGAMDARIVGVVQPGWIEAEQHIHFVARPVLGLIDLVVFHKGAGKVAHGGETGVFVDDGRIEGHPGMLVEPAADHLSIFRPVVVGVERGVDADKALSVFLDEREQVLLLACVHVHFAAGAGKDEQVKVVEILRVSRQVLLGEQFRVRAHGGIPQAALLAHVVDRGHGCRNGVVLPVLGLANHHHMFQVDLLGVGRRRQWAAPG